MAKNMPPSLSGKSASRTGPSRSSEPMTNAATSNAGADQPAIASRGRATLGAAISATASLPNKAGPVGDGSALSVRYLKAELRAGIPGPELALFGADDDVVDAVRRQEISRLLPTPPAAVQGGDLVFLFARADGHAEVASVHPAGYQAPTCCAGFQRSEGDVIRPEL